jgi:hypothetical protein
VAYEIVTVGVILMSSDDTEAQNRSYCIVSLIMGQNQDPLDRRLGGPQSCSGCGGEEKNSQHYTN